MTNPVVVFTEKSPLFSLNFFGDGLRDAFDPQTEKA